MRVLSSFRNEVPYVKAMSADTLAQVEPWLQDLGLHLRIYGLGFRA